MNQQDTQHLIDNCVSMAERLLLAQREFFPIGARIDLQGNFSFIALHDGDDFPLSTTLIDRFKDHLEGLLRDQDIRAYAITYDTRVMTPAFPDKVDAVTMLVKHQNADAILYYFPYRLNGSEIEYFESWGEKAN